MDHVSLKMREIVLNRRDVLNNLNDKDVIYVNYNGHFWKAVITSITRHNIAFPDFRVRLVDSGKLDKVAGVQIALEKEVPENLRY